MPGFCWCQVVSCVLVWVWHTSSALGAATSLSATTHVIPVGCETEIERREWCAHKWRHRDHIEVTGGQYKDHGNEGVEEDKAREKTRNTCFWLETEFCFIFFFLVSKIHKILYIKSWKKRNVPPFAHKRWIHDLSGPTANCTGAYIMVIPFIVPMTVHSDTILIKLWSNVSIKNIVLFFKMWMLYL